MATHTIPIFGIMTRVDNSGDVFPEPYSVKDSGAVIDPSVFIFNESGAKDGILGIFRVPEDYVSAPKILLPWNANATAGVLNIDLSYLTRAPGEDMGAAATSTSDNATDTKTGTAFVLELLTLTLTAGNFAANDMVLFELFRDSLDAADTLAVPAIIFGLYFQYSDA